jgi:uncharacterized protein
MTELLPKDSCINYVEFAVSSIERSKGFYGKAFGWSFTHYGDEYCEFSDGQMKGGFTTLGEPKPGGPLIVLYGDDLESLMAAVIEAGGTITRPVFEFPGGTRFQFTDPDGYELAIWKAA